jgi:hypothetical protein
MIPRLDCFGVRPPWDRHGRPRGPDKSLPIVAAMMLAAVAVWLVMLIRFALFGLS